MLLVVKQILVASTLGYVWRTNSMENTHNNVKVQVWFFDDGYFFSWKSKFSIYLLPADNYEKNQVHTGNMTHWRQILWLIKFYLIKNMKGIKEN